MTNVLDIDDFRPHSVAKINCDRCDHSWISTFPSICKILEKPCCGKFIDSVTFEEILLDKLK